MREILLRLRGVGVALIVLALSATLAFAAQAPAGGTVRAGSFEDNAGSGETAGDEGKNETETEATDADAAGGGDNCSTDPTTLTAEQFAAMSHGSMVCWAAHQETPDGYANHGAWVSHWAHLGKGNANADAARTKGKSKEHAPSN